MNLLEQILETVESIDRNVEEILDRVSDHLDDARSFAWYAGAFDPKNGYD